MELKILQLNEDKTNEIHSSPDCQQLISSMNEYYSKNGFNKPWVGYFIFKNNQIVGTGGFIGQPKDGKVEIAYWTFKEFEGQGIASFVCKELIRISKSTDSSIVITYPLREPLIVLAKPSMHLCRYGEQKYISSADHAVSHRSLQSKLHNSESLLPAA